MQPELAYKFLEVIKYLVNDNLKVRAWVNEMYVKDSLADKSKLANIAAETFEGLYRAAKEGKDTSSLVIDKTSAALFEKACQKHGLNISQLGDYGKKVENDSLSNSCLSLNVGLLAADAKGYTPSQSVRKF